MLARATVRPEPASSVTLSIWTGRAGVAGVGPAGPRGAKGANGNLCHVGFRFVPLSLA